MENKKERFVKLHFEFCERGHDFMNSTQAFVYLHMLNEYEYQKSKGNYYTPSQASLAKLSFASKPSVSSAIQHLIGLGLVKQNGGGKRGCTNVYEVFDWRENELIMSGTTNKEERDSYLEERGAKAYTNHKKAKEAEKQMNEPVKASESTPIPAESNTTEDAAPVIDEHGYAHYTDVAALKRAAVAFNGGNPNSGQAALWNNSLQKNGYVYVSVSGNESQRFYLDKRVE